MHASDFTYSPPLQLFRGNCEQVESWMVARENSLRSDDRDHLNSLQALMKKRDDLDKAITTQVKIHIKIPITTTVGSHMA